MADLQFEITKRIGIIAEGSKGWSMELNMVSWGGRAAKYDIRDWSPDHAKMGKGITLSEEQLRRLKEILNGL